MSIPVGHQKDIYCAVKCKFFAALRFRSRIPVKQPVNLSTLCEMRLERFLATQTYKEWKKEIDR